MIDQLCCQLLRQLFELQQGRLLNTGLIPDRLFAERYLRCKRQPHLGLNHTEYL